MQEVVARETEALLLFRGLQVASSASYRLITGIRETTGAKYIETFRCSRSKPQL